MDNDLLKEARRIIAQNTAPAPVGFWPGRNAALALLPDLVAEIERLQENAGDG